jgi:hypothetical protein
MDKKSSDETMDKLVKRVTVIQGSGENRRAEVVYERDDEDEDEKADFTSWMTDAQRTFMKAGQGVAKEASRFLPFKIPKLGAFGIPNFGPFGIPKSFGIPPFGIPKSFGIPPFGIPKSFGIPKLRDDKDDGE